MSRRPSRIIRRKTIDARHKMVTKLVLDIPEEKIKEYKESFDYYDKDNSGEIDVNELTKLFRSLGTTITKEEIQSTFESIDLSGDGKINFEEFTCICKDVIVEEINPALENKPVEEKPKSKYADQDDAIIKAFKLFDSDGSGTLNKNEFRYILTNFGHKLTNEEVDNIFKLADTDGNGEIDYKEFVAYWRKNFFFK